MGLIGDLIGGIIGSSSASKAAKAQETAAQTGLANSQANQTAATTAQSNATSSERQAAAPYTNAGASATNQLAQMAQAGYGQTFQAPTAAQAEATPGYKFELGQGEQAIQNQAAANGGLLSGGTEKALDQYANGLASTNYQQAYNNALTGYQQNYGQYTNQLNALQGISNTGAGVTANTNALTQQGAQNTGALDYNFSNAQNNQTTNYGNAKASGDIGKGNAWNNSINNANNQLMQVASLAANA